MGTMSILGLSTHSSRTNPIVLSRLFQWNITRFWLPAAVSLALLSAILFPLNLLTSQRFHHDEALYATWALEIASGENPLLGHTPIDKPPLFLYTVAATLSLFGVTETTARLPSLLATALTVGLTFWLGRKLYGDGVGLLAAWLVALSPFTILFAPTAFTDPLLVAFVLAGCLTAAYGRAGWAGMFLGLAIATKQQGVFFVPLVVALLGSSVKCQVPSVTFHVSRFTFHASLTLLLTTFLTLLPVFLGDLARDQSPGFWQLSLINYGGLDASARFGERWWEFVELLKYGTASPILNTIFVAGLPLLLIYGIRQHQTDWIFFLFALAFLLGHALLSFQVWDRYLLGLIPLLALLLARILLLPWSILKQSWLNHHPKFLPVAALVNSLALICLLTITLASSVRDAVNARYPLGSNSHALNGIEQITAYLQGHAGADTTLYHRWLGTHWRFYLWGYPYDLQYWPSTQHLANRAKPGHLIAFPSWHSETEARLALAEAGLRLQELTRAYTPAGYPSIVLYQIIEKEVGSKE
jgi:4-amino-4-deoxy-L-arabinose transferase-like glycosyltransferase